MEDSYSFVWPRPEEEEEESGKGKILEAWKGAEEERSEWEPEGLECGGF